MRHWLFPLILSSLSGCVSSPDASLWQSYEESFRKAKYVDLTHTISPTIPVWSGFLPSRFGRAVKPATGEPYRYDLDGFEAGRYELATDQLGTQLDPPAHWNPQFPAIDELPPTFALRPLVVVSIVEQVKADPGYSLQVPDLLDWEGRNGRIPEGSVVFVRSDWSKGWPQDEEMDPPKHKSETWPNPTLSGRRRFPGVSLQALRFLHEQRHILLHGHEPLDTDDTPELEGETWLLRNGYTQAEGVANLYQVPEKGALVVIGYPKLRGGLGGLARFVAICPPDWPYGVGIGQVPEAPLARLPHPLQWDATQGYRRR